MGQTCFSSASPPAITEIKYPNIYSDIQAFALAPQKRTEERAKIIAGQILVDTYRPHRDSYQTELPTGLLTEIYRYGAEASRMEKANATCAIWPFVFLMNYFTKSPYYNQDNKEWSQKDRLAFFGGLTHQYPGSQSFSEQARHILHNIEHDLDVTDSFPFKGTHLPVLVRPFNPINSITT